MPLTKYQAMSKIRERLLITSNIFTHFQLKTKGYCDGITHILPYYRNTHLKILSHNKYLHIYEWAQNAT